VHLSYHASVIREREIEKNPDNSDERTIDRCIVHRSLSSEIQMCGCSCRLQQKQVLATVAEWPEGHRRTGTYTPLRNPIPAHTTVVEFSYHVEYNYICS